MKNPWLTDGNRLLNFFSPDNDRYRNLPFLRSGSSPKFFTLLPLCLLMLACSTDRSSMRSTAFFYGSQVPVASLARFERVVVQSDHVGDLDGLRASGAEVYAYLSVGEAEDWRVSARSLPPGLFFGSNPMWRNRIVDLTQPGWQQYLLEQRMAPLWDIGYRGFFLDTLDSYQLVAKDARAQAAQAKALTGLIRAMHRRFPGVKLLFNRGFDVLPEVGSLAAGLVAESLFRGWDPATGDYVPVNERDRIWLLTRLNNARARYGLPITVIDYVPPHDIGLARETARRIMMLGFFPWVANPELDVLAVGVDK